MVRGNISSCKHPGAIIWRPDRDESKREELKQLSKRDLKSMMKQGDLGGPGFGSFDLETWRFESCGSVEFFAREKHSGLFG